MPGMGMPMAPGMMQQQQFLQEQHMQRSVLKAPSRHH
jgi:hypothetical protein